MAQQLVNRVANSPLITLDLEKLFYPEEDIVAVDLKDFLFQGLILKEKEFRASLADKDWSSFKGKIVHVHCSADAIIPMWAYMLISTYLSEVAREIYYGDFEVFISKYFREKILNFDISPYTNKKIILKGCSDRKVPASAYMDMSNRLKPIARSLMFGEPCSTVPIYKKKSKSHAVES